MQERKYFIYKREHLPLGVKAFTYGGKRRYIWL